MFKRTKLLIKFNILNIFPVFTFLTLGYRGFIKSVKSENKFGESFGKLTQQSLSGTIEKGSDIPPYNRYTSTTRENFINQRQVKIQSTAELLGVQSRKDVYKKVFFFFISPYLSILLINFGVSILKS